MLKNMVKIAKVLSTDDTGDNKFYIVSMLGKKQQVAGFMPYGLFGSPTANSMGLVLSQQGQESNGICIASDPKNRPVKNTVNGEIGLGNFKTGGYLFFNDSGVCIGTSDSFEINGSADTFVKWIPLDAALQLFVTWANAHTHGGAAPTSAFTLDMTAAKTLTVKTDG